MKVYAPEAIRNVGLLSHMGNGKTSLAEAMPPPARSAAWGG